MADRKLSSTPFVLHSDFGQDRLTVPIGRLHPLVPVFKVFLSIWSVGCIAVVIHLATGQEAIPAKALGMLAAGWVFGAFFLASWLTGKETLWFEGRDMHVVTGAFGLKRSRRFGVDEIREVRLEPRPFWSTRLLLDFPFALARQYGSIGFTYRGRKVALLPGVEEIQAEMILGWIRKHLPGAQSSLSGTFE